MQWISELVAEARHSQERQRQENEAAERGERLVQEGAAAHWTGFIDEVRRCASSLNAAMGADEIAVAEDRGDSIALRNQGVHSRQFVAKFLGEEHQGEVSLALGRSITIVACPIAADASGALAFVATSGERYDQERAAKELLGSYFRFILGFEAPSQGDARRVIGFGAANVEQ